MKKKDNDDDSDDDGDDGDDDETGFQCSGHLRTQAQWGADPGCCLSYHSINYHHHHHPHDDHHHHPHDDHHPYSSS